MWGIFCENEGLEWIRWEMKGTCILYYNYKQKASIYVHILRVSNTRGKTKNLSYDVIVLPINH